jgi:hypothetical protein
VTGNVREPDGHKRNAAPSSGPGCPRHEGDPHNLCEACWALEPDPATLSVTQGGIGRETAPFFPPEEADRA